MESREEANQRLIESASADRDMALMAKAWPYLSAWQRRRIKGLLWWDIKISQPARQLIKRFMRRVR